MISIQIRGIDQLQAKFSKSINPALQAASLAIGEEIRDKLAVYPGPAHKPVKWASRKQRAAYFAQRKERGLPLRYTRNSDPMSQRLGPSWTVQKKGSMGATVGTKVSYAPWVQGKDAQSPQHKATGWRTDWEAAALVESSPGKIQRIVTQALAGWMK